MSGLTGSGGAPLDNIEEEFDGIPDKIRKRMEDYGFILSPKPRMEIDGIELNPDGSPFIPYDITTVSLDELGKLMNMYNSWYDFVSQATAIAETESDCSSFVRESMWSRLRLGAEGTASDKDDKVRTDPRYIRILAKFLVTQGVKKLLKAKSKHSENCSSILSRELTRRQTQTEQERTTNNAPRRAKQISGELSEIRRFSSRSKSSVTEGPRPESETTGAEGLYDD